MPASADGALLIHSLNCSTTIAAMACLELVSLSSRALEQADDSYDLAFDLSSKPLPAFSAINCWRRRTISPLRDRVMIEWLFSHYEAELLLTTITTAINEAMKERSATLSTDSSSETGEKAPSSALCVAIGCQNGAQHSVCFVEKLYEQYSFSAESPLELVDGVRVKVKRRHCEATKGEWLSTKDAVWQHSQFPVKHISNHRVLLFNRAWSNFPLESVRQIEAAFLENPFSSGVDIGKNIINYERGIFYNKKSEEEFRIRSIVPSSVENVHSSWLQDDEYSQLHKSYTSAGILFYSVHPRTGEAVFLLGHMTYGAMAWCDFGGLKKEKARYTAARECYEETFGILGKTKHLVSMLENYKENNVFKIVNKGTKYVGHFLRVPYKDYPSAFEKALEVAATDQVEVDEMRWFSLSSLRSGVQKALLDQSVFKVEPLNEDGSVDSSQQLPLRFELVHSLCIADQLGVLNSIEHIAATLHGKNQPPPPRYVSYPKPRQSSKDPRLNDNLCLEKSEKDQSGQLSEADGGTSQMTLEEKCNADSAGEEGSSSQLNLTSMRFKKDSTLSNEEGGVNCHLRRRKGKSKCEEHDLSLNKATTCRHTESETVITENTCAASNTSTSKVLRYYGIGAGSFLY